MVHVDVRGPFDKVIAIIVDKIVSHLIERERGFNKAVVVVVEWVWVGRSGLLDGEEEAEGEREVKASETERRV